ncbi:MAG: DUF502 domain-containing protein [Pacificimonas sp.]|jgi:uncharacterized membrane protein|nr:DUF502 domain-containing protein [Pacificimonas sp.]
MDKFRDPLKPPRRTPWRDTLDRTIGTFLTGLVFLLPIIITLMILDWFIRQIGGLFGEDTILGTAIFGSSTLIFGDSVVGIWIIFALVIAAIWGAGRLFQKSAQRSIQERMEGWVSRIPIIGSIYRPVSQLTRMLGMRDEHELASMRPIACRFGGENGVDILALLASSTPVQVGGKPRMLVYLPSAPLPMTGALMLVPKDNVVEVEGIGVDDLLAYYISLGTVTPDALDMDNVAAPEAAAAIAADATAPQPDPQSQRRPDLPPDFKPAPEPETGSKPARQSEGE